MNIKIKSRSMTVSYTKTFYTKTEIGDMFSLGSASSKLYLFIIYCHNIRTDSTVNATVVTAFKTYYS